MMLIIWLVSCVAVKLMLDYSYNYAHESVHARIYENNNISYDMHVSPFASWCEGKTETKATIRDHNMAEVVGYHLKVVYDLIYYFMAVMILIMVVL